ncbi:hypothetical protein ACFFUB_15095 [Algimonas porphyrae]|uniref:Serine endopeptidase n=1 Tax=Algimonas porphyrae TaxID=1128113 RepID=A0ABQ5UZ93_9PROT|nr:hypothetical protein [Algimonas porphyrae]GLQ19754.1 hypothetical protein GCM10007854_07090 [Algimonas porphyrae]
MAKSTRRPQQFYAIVMWVLSVIFAGFLIGLGSLIIRDIPRVDQPVLIEQFVDANRIETLRESETLLESQTLSLRRRVEDAVNAQSAATADYRAARASFDNWIATRTATQADATNPEVLVRTRELEGLTDQIRQADNAVEQAQQVLRDQQRVLADTRDAMVQLRADADPDYRRARRAQEFRVFAFRLALTLPLLLLSGWMLAKKRRSPYWPLYRGFVLFSLFAFFVELVPYLPSYGGYVRYTVGILTVIISGYFLIKQMRRYLARKQAEEARSEVERRQSIDYETALKKIAAKTCPGCDRSIVNRDGVHSDYCVHCGIHLQKECESCGTRNVTFYRYCLSCGTPNAETPGVQSQSA